MRKEKLMINVFNSKFDFEKIKKKKF